MVAKNIKAMKESKSLGVDGLHIDEHCWALVKPMASLSTCHLGLWFG